MRSVLVVDDDPAVLGFLEKAFRREGYSVACSHSGEEALQSYSRDSSDLVILDLNLPDISGQQVLERLLLSDPEAVVIMLTGEVDVSRAVDAMRSGAENFLPKPVDTGHLFAAADRAFEKTELRRRTRYLESREKPGDQSVESLGSSPALREVEQKIRLVAPTDTTVLILGETGTGKSRAACLIHNASDRSQGPYVEVNCAALTPTFLSSELFGHEKGAFTDAKTKKRGLMEVADHGTLLLDEIGDLAPEIQPKLLHVIETRRFRRMGGTRDIETGVRLLAATNRDLKTAVQDGTFREDLYYRIAVMNIELPPVRERDRDDIATLVVDLLQSLHTRASATPKRVTPQTMQRLIEYSWPGNVREMRNVLERAIILAGNSPRIEVHHLPAEVARTQPENNTPSTSDIGLTLDELAHRHITRVLAFCDGNRSKAARMLGISRGGLYKKLKRFENDDP